MVLQLHSTTLLCLSITFTDLLNLDNIFSLMCNSPTILGGDFNAHHHIWNDPPSNTANKTCSNGLHIQQLLTSFPDVKLLNKHTPTHLRGGVFDLTFLSSDLLPTSDWTLHPYLTSDHFATVPTLNLSRLVPVPPCPRWNFSKADWGLFSSIMEDWADSYSPSPLLDTHERDVITALHQAADAAIPVSAPTPFRYRDQWYHNKKVKQLKNLLLQYRRLLRRHPSTDTLTSFRAANKVIQKEIREIRRQ